MKLKETIVVEGRDDESAVLAAIDVNIICTHGFGIRPETIRMIEKAYETTGIIVFTDPDHAGETIRARLTKLFPEAKQAFLTKEQAKKDMTQMVDYIDKLSVFDTTGIEPMSHVFPVQNVFREDVVTNGDESEKTLMNAPGTKDNMFMVPKTFD